MLQQAFKLVRLRKPIFLNRSMSSLQSDDKKLPDLKLRQDIKMIGSILGESIKEFDPEVFDAVERLRFLGREVSCYYSYIHHVLF
jgi:hypothetical protein